MSGFTHPEPIIRAPSFALESTLPRHWHGNSPVATHVFNGLSFLFPQAERYFIQCARNVLNTTTITDEKLLSEIKIFIAQEQMHTKEHEIYNHILESQGYHNDSHRIIEHFFGFSSKHLSPLHNLAFVTAFEHYTAILGDWALTQPKALEGADERMKLIWGWHGIEEIEHKGVCYDLYEQAGGGWLMRVWAFWVATVMFNYTHYRNFIFAMRADWLLTRGKRWSSFVATQRFIWGKGGAGRHLLAYSFDFLRPNFHPWQHNNAHIRDAWLATNMVRLGDKLDKQGSF